MLARRDPDLAVTPPACPRLAQSRPARTPAVRPPIAAAARRAERDDRAAPSPRPPPARRRPGASAPTIWMPASPRSLPHRLVDRYVGDDAPSCERLRDTARATSSRGSSAVPARLVSSVSIAPVEIAAGRSRPASHRAAPGAPGPASATWRAPGAGPIAGRLAHVGRPRHEHERQAAKCVCHGCDVAIEHRLHRRAGARAQLVAPPRRAMPWCRSTTPLTPP